MKPRGDQRRVSRIGPAVLDSPAAYARSSLPCTSVPEKLKEHSSRSRGYGFIRAEFRAYLQTSSAEFSPMVLVIEIQPADLVVDDADGPSVGYFGRKLERWHVHA